MPAARTNVLVVGDFANINGGQAKVAIETARLLADAGHRVAFFAASGEPDPLLDHPAISVEVLGQADILAETNRARAALRGIWNSQAAARLEALAAKFDPADTVLHCHGYAKALSPAIGPVLTGGRLRSVYTMHEYFLACPNGGFYDYQRGEICTRKALGADCLTTQCDVRHAAHKAWRVARQAVTWGPGTLPRGLSDVIYISETQRRFMAPYMDPATRLHHVPNPVGGSQAPVDAPANRAAVFVGRFNPEKGAAIMAEAARIAGVPAIFVGDGADEPAIRDACPDAIVTGWQTPEQVADWIGKARMLVFPSVWAEPFGLVAYEALNRGVPVVAGRWNAASEFFTHGVSGAVYDRPEAGALAEAMQLAGSLPRFDPAPFRAASSPQTYLERLLAVFSTALSG